MSGSSQNAAGAKKQIGPMGSAVQPFGGGGMGGSKGGGQPSMGAKGGSSVSRNQNARNATGTGGPIGIDPIETGNPDPRLVGPTDPNARNAARSGRQIGPIGIDPIEMGNPSRGRVDARGNPINNPSGPSIYDRASQAVNRGYDAQDRLLGELMNGPWAKGQGPKAYGMAADKMANPASIASQMQKYMNPYTQDVIDRNATDINRQTQMGINDIGAKAAGQGAFGGSRLGLAEGTAVSEGARALGDISANLRQQGFDKAAGYAGQDIGNDMTADAANQAAINNARQFNAGQKTNAQINKFNQKGSWLDRLSGAASGGLGLGQQGVNLGQQIQGATGADAALTRSISEALMGQSAGMFDAYTSQPWQGIERVLGALSGNPISGTGTQTNTSNPGLKSTLGAVAGTGARIASGGKGG